MSAFARIRDFPEALIKILLTNTYMSVHRWDYELSDGFVQNKRKIDKK